MDNLTCRSRDCREDLCPENKVCQQINLSFECVISNPCESNNGGCSHICTTNNIDLNPICICPQSQILLEDNKSCGCPKNTVLTDSRYCKNISVCNSNNGNCEQICEDSFTGSVCSCFEGFQPYNSTHCQDIDECLEKNICEQECLNSVGSFQCKCWTGYFMNEINQCEDIDECAISSPCEYNCKNLIGGFECYCPENFMLSYDNMTCENVIRPCEAPSFIEQGVIKCNKKSSQCEIACDENYALEGSALNICIDGKWTNDFAKCLRKS